MADQPGRTTPDARPPDPTRVDAGGSEPSTVDAPARWSGSAAIPPPQPKKSLWSRRPAPPAEEPDDWGTTPAVDPWAGQDTPVDPLLIPAPAARQPLPQPPPTRIETPQPPQQPQPEQPRRPPPMRTGAQSEATETRPPVAPRPGYVPPEYARKIVKGPPPAPPRRRKHRALRNLGLFSLLSLVFCGAVPAYFLWPAARQYPVSAVLPSTIADLDLRDDSASRRAAARLAGELNDAKAFAAVYGDGNGKRVTVFGTTGLRLTPEADVEAQIRQLSGDYDLADVRAFDMGETGVHERCGVGKAGRNTVVVCAWADHGSLATVLLTRRSVDDSADLTAAMRSAVLNRG